MRSMVMKLDGHVVYSSKFEEKTGTIVRAVEESHDRWERIPHRFEDAYRKKFPRRWSTGIHSPTPETIDVSITDKCGFGCSYCYMDSRPESDHAPKELVETIIQGFDVPPFQMAIGGGEPTIHPDLPYILKTCRGLGTVPNYTTAGDKISQRVVDATNEYCGGVAMTYHAFKGIDWFVEHYCQLREKLKCQLNVHVIADKNVVKCLRALADRAKQLGPLNIVLLAYYPDVGRASLDSLVTKRIYMKELPDAITLTRLARFKVAFSEGLFPYFLSRPEIGIDTTFATPMEGRFSCYFDTKGRIFSSSFNQRPYENQKTAFETPSQLLWDEVSTYNEPHGEDCYDCQYKRQCSTPSDFHYLLCNFASHNRIGPAYQPKTVYDHLLEDDED